MKLRTLGVAVAIFGLAACDKPADKPAEPTPVAPADAAPTEAAKPADADAAPTPTEEEKAKPEPTPVEACVTLIGAATAKDDTTFLANSTEATAQAIGDPATKDMVYGLLGTNATCGEAAIDGDKATVDVMSGKEKRDIPFVKIGDAWKFDSAEYMNKYPPQPEPKAKKGKGAKAKAKA